MERSLISSLHEKIGEEVIIRGWIYRVRALAKVTFIIIKDCSGIIQCVATPEVMAKHHVKLDDAVELHGKVRAESRSKVGFEVDVVDIKMLNESITNLPFNSSSDITQIGQETILDYRPLSLRHQKVGAIFKVQAKIAEGFREYLTKNHFTEIITSKIVGSGTEGGTNLFEIKYFERSAYLAQSPQFYKEHGVCGLERVFETGHVYRAEPHATSRHLTEYYSLDLEFGFIDGPEDVMQLERELLTYIFDKLNKECDVTLKEFGIGQLPSMLKVPAWEFGECLTRLKSEFGRTDLTDDLDPEAERQLGAIAEKETGISAVFVVGFPLSARPFYTYPRGATGAAQSFDLLYRGLEITTGGQRLHKRSDLESALRNRKIDPTAFESHLKMFDLGVPPHGGLAIGLERLTCQVLGLQNIREATLYPRDKNRIVP